MQMSDKDKPQIADEDVIEGEATVIDDTGRDKIRASKAKANKAKAAQKTQTADKKAHSSQPSGTFPKLAFGALVMALLSLGGSFYMALLMIDMETELHSYKADSDKAQSQAQMALNEVLTSVQKTSYETDKNQSKLQDAVAQLKTDLGIVQSQIADIAGTNQATMTDAVVPLELSVVMVMWADAIKGERLDHYGPIINNLAASQTKTSLIDILALAGDSAHDDLQKQARQLNQMSSAIEEEGVTSTMFDDLTSWFGEFVNLRPAPPSIETERRSIPALSDGQLSSDDTARLTTLDSWYAHLSQSDITGDDYASWQIEVKARLRADAALTSLLQALIKGGMKG